MNSYRSSQKEPIIPFKRHWKNRLRRAFRMIKLSMYGKWKDRFYWCDDCNLRVPKLKSGGMGGGFINHMLLMLYHKPGCKGKY